MPMRRVAPAIRRASGWMTAPLSAISAPRDERTSQGSARGSDRKGLWSNESSARRGAAERSAGWLESLGGFVREPVGLVHTQKIRHSIRKAHLGTTSDTRLFSGEERTSHFKRLKSVHDPNSECARKLAKNRRCKSPTGKV